MDAWLATADEDEVFLSGGGAWGDLMVRSQRSGRALAPMDAFFAATAQSHDLTLVTRNTQDFDRLSIPLLNPWEVG